MFRLAIYFNTILFFALAILFLVKVFNGESDLKKIKRLSYIYIVLNIINGYASELSDTRWNGIWLFLGLVITLILNIVTIICSKKR